VAVIEIERFRLAAGVSDEEFRRLDAALQQWCYVAREGLARRTTAVGADGEVVVVTVWHHDPTSPEEIDAPANDELDRAIDRSTYRREVFRTLG